MAWTNDIRTGAIDILASYVPFTIITLSVARLPWNRLRVKLLYGELAAMALVFRACVGFYQDEETRQIFENPKLLNSNSYAALFRVNSLFYDPFYPHGRALVVALVATAVVIVRGKSVRAGLAALALAAVLWLGLLISFSQSSFSALFVAVFCLCAFVWRWKALAVLVVAVMILVAGAVSAPRLMHSSSPPRGRRDQLADERARQPHLRRPAHREAASRQRRRPRWLLEGVPQAHPPEDQAQRLTQHSCHRRR